MESDATGQRVQPGPDFGHSVDVDRRHRVRQRTVHQYAASPALAGETLDIGSPVYRVQMANPPNESTSKCDGRVADGGADDTSDDDEQSDEGEGGGNGLSPSGTPASVIGVVALRETTGRGIGPGVDA